VFLNGKSTPILSASGLKSKFSFPRPSSQERDHEAICGRRTHRHRQ
jgi:hypothetical protein